MLRKSFFAFGLLAVTAQIAYGQGNNDGFNLQTRWSQTATSGSGLQQGDATTLTWSVVPDGTFISGAAGEAASNSDLVAFLDTNIGAGGGGSDLTNRPWYTLMESGYGRWGEVAGLRMIYEANDDGLTPGNGIDGTTQPRGALGVRGDFRVGGHFIDGQSGILAYNYFPDHGDQVMDTGDSNFYSNSSSNFRRFRNVIAHEAGHGLGLGHITSSDANFLMEPFINVSFDGPQFADVLGMHRGYGDINERDGGNDTFSVATSLGSLGDGDSFLIGEDATDLAVALTDVDFVSIDGTTDTDFFSFDLLLDGDLFLELTPLGPTYNVDTAAGGTFNAAAQNDLTLTLFDTDGTTILAQSNTGGFGDAESLTQSLLSGTYFARVTGSNDGAQFFQLSGSFSAVPEPTTTGLFALLATGMLASRRKRRAV